MLPKVPFNLRNMQVTIKNSETRQHVHMSTSGQKFLYSGTETDITDHAAALIIAEAYRSVKDHGLFSLVLAGGNSPRQLYRQLAQGVAPDILERFGIAIPRQESDKSKGHIIVMPWEKTWLFWGDERSVPVGHPDSNYNMARETMLLQAPVPDNHIFRMPAEQEDGESAAKKYEETILTFFKTAYPLSVLTWPIFDLIILGVGDDGHTASLFAGNTDALKETTKWVVSVNEALAKPPGKRLTITLPVINHARNVLFFTSGKNKAWLANKIFLNEEMRVPASLVALENGNVYWFTTQL